MSESRPDQPALSPAISPRPKTPDHLCRDLVIGLSLANVLLVRSWFGLFDTTKIFYLKTPVTRTALLAMTINILFLGLLFCVVIRLVRRTKNALIHRLAVLGLYGLFFIPVIFLYYRYYSLVDLRLLSLLRNPIIFIPLLLAAIVVLRWYRLAGWFATRGLLLLSPLCLFNFGRFLAYGLHVAAFPQPAQDPPLVPLLAQQASPVRIVWIIFDELEERAAFDQRPSHLQLPEFTRLRSECLVATNARPPGGTTVMSFPSLTTGRPLQKVDTSPANELLVTWSDTGKTEGWSTQTNLFWSARQLGFNVGVVGWYLPYAKLFHSCLSACSWYAYPTLEYARGVRFGECLLNQARATLIPWHLRCLDIDIFEKTRDDALRLATNSQFGLILLHLPIPHWPGIYDPSSGRYTATSFATEKGYFDNLILTDHTLGELRRAMETAGLWDKAWVLISADHWWRYNAPILTPVDYRVPFILKGPGKNIPIKYGTPFDTRVTFDLFLAVLRGQLKSEEAALDWLQQHQIDPPQKYDYVYGWNLYGLGINSAQPSKAAK